MSGSSDMKQLIAILLLTTLSACGSAPKHGASPAPFSDEQMSELVMYAVSLSDTPYRYGGNSPENGFDCSGFVGHVFQHSLGIHLPRTSHDLSNIGKPIKSHQLRPGDLVFFNTQGHAYSHVGIFIGEEKFVHSPKTGSRIRVERMNESYWASRYSGARRVRA